jgi:hypothetical protein
MVGGEATGLNVEPASATARNRRCVVRLHLNVEPCREIRNQRASIRSFAQQVYDRSLQ